MKNVFKFMALSALLMSFALFAGSVFAQTSTTGSIEGTVTDQAGAAVPGIAVKVSSSNLISAPSLRPIQFRCAVLVVSDQSIESRLSSNRSE